MSDHVLSAGLGNQWTMESLRLRCSCGWDGGEFVGFAYKERAAERWREHVKLSQDLTWIRPLSARGLSSAENPDTH